jgi:hypothetical protein
VRRADELRERMAEMAEKDAERARARDEWKAKRAAEAAAIAVALNARIAVAREKDAAVITNRRAEYAAKLEAVAKRNKEKAEREKEQRASGGRSGVRRARSRRHGPSAHPPRTRPAPPPHAVVKKEKQNEIKLGRRTNALERAHNETADRARKLLETIAARDVHIAEVHAASVLENEERVLRAALHQADKEASILKSARATEYARLRQLSKVMEDEERLVAEAASRERVWRERQEAQRRFIIARDLKPEPAKKVEED